MNTRAKKVFSAALMSGGLMFSGLSEAVLMDRGNGMIYDTVLNVTWLQDANYAKTSGQHETGLMNWEQANAWADSLVYGGVSDWRLPTLSAANSSAFEYEFAYDGSTDYGYNITSPNSELAYMYHVNLLNRGFYSIFGDEEQLGWNETPNAFFRDGVTNEAKSIANLEANVFWTNLEYAPDNASFAWAFATDFGVQSDLNKSGEYLAWAVRSGDIAAVPLPAPVWFLGSSLLGLMGLRRKGAI